MKARWGSLVVLLLLGVAWLVPAEARPQPAANADAAPLIVLVMLQKKTHPFVKYWTTTTR